MLQSLENMVGGELFVPKIPACSVADMAYVAPGCEWDTIGLRRRKSARSLDPADESETLLNSTTNTHPTHPILWGNKIGILGGVSATEGFVYASNCNCETLSEEQLKVLLKDFLPSTSD